MSLNSSSKGKLKMSNIDGLCPSPEERRHMIETAAYYRAEQRGFFDGDPVKDWLEAEKEIETSCRCPDNGPVCQPGPHHDKKLGESLS